MDSLLEAVMKNVYILAIGETKIDGSFPTAQFHLVGYHSTYRLDKFSWNGRILLNAKFAIPSRKLIFSYLPFKAQAIPLELNLRNEKSLVVSIYMGPLWNY